MRELVIRVRLVENKPKYMITYTERYSRLQVNAEGETLEEALNNLKNIEIANFVTSALTTKLRKNDFNC